jgi:hypothetical protein
MATTIIAIGDTITFRAEFRDTSNALVDPDGSAATFTVYNNETLAKVVNAQSATRVSTGVYTYDWLVPDGDGTVYVLEMKGLFSTKPQLKRKKAKAKFRPSS